VHPAPARLTVAVSRRRTFVLKTLPATAMKTVGAVRPPDSRFKQSRASAAVRGAAIVRGSACRIRVLPRRRFKSAVPAVE